MQELYGGECQIYNFRVLRHLHEFVRFYGPLVADDPRINVNEMQIYVTIFLK